MQRETGLTYFPRCLNPSTGGSGTYPLDITAAKLAASLARIDGEETFPWSIGMYM
jgi:hypothetical protein